VSREAETLFGGSIRAAVNADIETWADADDEGRQRQVAEIRFVNGNQDCGGDRMRYFYASEKTASYGGWSEIEYIGFPSVGHGTIYNKDGSTKSFDENLAWALRAVETGGWVEVFPVDPAVAKANENAAIDLDAETLVVGRPSGWLLRRRSGRRP
jgi:hypothetical protein